MKLKLYNYYQEKDALLIFDNTLSIIDINDEAKSYFEIEKDIEGDELFHKIKNKLQINNFKNYLYFAFKDDIELCLKGRDNCRILLSSRNTEELSRVSIVVSRSNKALNELIGSDDGEISGREGILYLDERNQQLFFTIEFLELFNIEYKKNMSSSYVLRKILKKIDNRNNIINLISNKFNKYNEFLGVINLKDGRTIEFVYKRYNLDNELKGILCNFRALNKEIIKINYDQTSELLEKELLLEEMDFLIKNSINSRKKMSLFSINIKSFKNINNLYGIKMGNYILKKTAKRLKRLTRIQDIVGRYSADEFLILVNDYEKEEDLDKIANRIINKLSMPIKLVNRTIYIEPSIGISTCKGNDIEEIIKKSFSALKYSKKSKNQISYYNEYLEVLEKDRLVLENELKEAIVNKDFIIHYQPQISLLENDIFAIEALVRWKHKDGRFISPEKFIPIAEELDLIKDIEAIVLEKSIMETEKIRDKFNLKLAINLSNKQFIDESFINKIKKYNIDMSFLEIEITESTAVIDFDKSLEMINRYKELGIGIAIDDFGVGYSSLCHLKSLPIDVIKIDKSFIDNIVNNKGDKTLVQAVLLIAETLKVEVIAEGVENELQLNILKELGCLKFQGYYFDKPCSIAELTKNLTKKIYKNRG